MSLRYALLGFLNLAPMTGYDLKRNLDRSTQSFWHAGLNQIYPTLKSLEENGWITSRLEPQDGKPDRKIYSLTTDGEAELLDWLERPERDLSPGKNPALLKLFFSGYLGRDRILLHLRTQLDLHRAALSRYRDEVRPMVADIVARTGRAREGTMWELVRRLGERHEAAWVEWLEQAIDTVEALE
jgi:PadR family transcriptional regulator AphA